MIYTSKLHKGLKMFLVSYAMMILTVKFHHVNAGVENNNNDAKYKLTAEQNNLQTNENEHEQVGFDGVGIIDNEIQTSPLMSCIQEGIWFALRYVEINSQYTSNWNDNMDILRNKINVAIDTDKTPACSSSKFIFNTYAPLAFHYLRDLFEIKTKDYIESFNNRPLRELSGLGASRSMFYITWNDKFIMKTVQKTEVGFLRKILPDYSNHLEKNPRSMLSKFSGLYSYKYNSVTGKLVSMNNFLPSNIEIHIKYELKGSTFEKKASDEENLKKTSTIKDLDFKEHHPDRIFLMPDTLEDLFKTIKIDCDFLKSFSIMNYSLLVGVHNIDKVSVSTPLYQASVARWERLMVNSIGMDNIQADTDTLPEKDCASLRGSIPAKNANGERLLLFVGIIDILQVYGTTENLVNIFKNVIQYNAVSVQPPNLYAQQLIEYLETYQANPSLLRLCSVKKLMLDDSSKAPNVP